MNAPLPPVELPAGLGALAPRFDLILCDVWGVIHNGLTAYRAAADALTRFRRAGGTVILISNAPRPGSAVLPGLDRMGVPRTAYDDIITSGDLTRAMVAERPGEPVYHMGPERDRPIFEGLDVRFTGPEEATYCVCSGLDDDETDTVEDHREELERLRARDLLMICANPDLVVERGHELIPCAGAVAVAYEEMGGRAVYLGKPHRPVYEAALARAAEIRGEAVDRARVLAVGDAIRTDVAGACGVGIASLFVARGIHTDDLGLREGSLDADVVRGWLSRQAYVPTAAVETLSWE